MSSMNDDLPVTCTAKGYQLWTSGILGGWQDLSMVLRYTRSITFGDAGHTAGR
jgi:hypothetical protein